MRILLRAMPATFVVLWATGFIGARYAMPWAEPFTFLSARFVLALAVLVAILLVIGGRRANLPSALHAMIAGALMHGVYLGGVYWAIYEGMPAGICALIVGLQPMLTALLAGPALGERILPRHWTGLAVGFAGVVIVVLPGLAGKAAGIDAATLAACLVAVAAMSAGTVWQKRFVGGLDLVTGTLWQYLGAAMLALAVAVPLETHAVTINGELVFALAWLVLVLSIGAVFLLMYLIREGEISKVSSLFYLVPAVTAVMAWLLFGEALAPVQVVGMAVTTLGVALATQRAPQPGTRSRASR